MSTDHEREQRFPEESNLTMQALEEPRRDRTRCLNDLINSTNTVRGCKQRWLEVGLSGPSLSFVL